MKSVTIRARRNGEIIIKVLRQKSGAYILEGNDMVLDNMVVDVRDDENKKVRFA